ncbi:A disintegrin and metalloproteinase with thrombospondin motifs 2, partial [Acropora cervicornis]
HLIKTLADYDVTYPTELDHSFRVTDHVTTLSSHTRRRRSVTGESEPIIYQVQFKGQSIRMVLKLNTKLFGSSFTVERHKEDGSIETKTVTEQCYLVGETESLHSSVAISDCDGLAGIIDLGNDTIYIEPVLNTSLIIHRGWTRPGRPHLVYRKAILDSNEQHDLALDQFVGSGDYPTGLNVEKMNDTSAARTESAYVLFVNSAGRAVKLYYIVDGTETLFRVLEDRATKSVNTFTVHGWIARDYDTGKQLVINRERTFYAPEGTSVRERHRAYITVPSNLRLPPPTKPSQPNSHLSFINRSNRFVKLYYIEAGETIFFHNLPPHDVILVNTYTSHRWFAKDLDTLKVLHVNGQNQYAPEETSVDRPIQVLITVPSTMSLSSMKFPDMLNGKPKYIEVMATADSSVIKFHGKEKSEKLYQHKSIGTPVYFVVVKLVLLENDPKEIKINGKPMPSLSSVCYWGHKARKGFDSSTKDFYDQTVFITRKDFGPSGYAPVHGMCWRRRSCTLNEEDGFTSAFIIAHETGHTLGMEHDGVNNNCSNDVIKGSIMAPLVRSRFDRFYWSSCSRRDLISKLRALWCLNDVPFRNTIPHLKKLPGQLYTIDAQCQREFGSNSRFCRGMKRDPCKELWCIRLSYVSLNNRFCQTKSEPALEGTQCGQNKWCRLGKCVPMNDDNLTIPLPRPTVKPTHGGWSSWTELSACSRSCGVGVHYRTRKCNNPVPQNDGRQCEGKDIKFELCNVKDCPGKLRTFEQIRNEQCQRRAPLVAAGIRGLTSTVILKMACVAGQTTARMTMIGGATGVTMYFWRLPVPSVPDGKLVLLASTWACVLRVSSSGITLLVGENVAWSVNKNRGNRWVLKYVTIFSKRPYRIIFQGIRGDGYLSDFGLDDISLENNPCGLGLMRLTPINNQIPLNPCQQFCQASSNVAQVEVENGTACHDSLRSFDVCILGQCQVVGCDGVMGSNKTLDRCDLQTLLECPVGATNIMLKDSSPNDLIAMGEKRPQIDVTDEKLVSTAYEFAGSKFTYRREGDKEAITALGPIKDKIVVKVRVGDGGATPVNLQYQFYKPTSTRVQYRWSHFKWSDCSKTCGEGIRTELFKCIEQDNNTEVEEHHCYSINKPAPGNKFCNLTACEIYEWIVSQWSKCSSPCNGGNQTRTMECRGLLTGVKVNSSLCSRVRPKTKQECNVHSCSADWIVSNWSKCPTTCGSWRQYRSVWCRNILGELSLNCPRDVKPPSRRICRNKPCEGEIFSNMSCTFEAGFCHWKNMRNSQLDQFDWTLRNGSTPSRNTGPSNDHTLGTSRGVYAYIEASEPQQRNDRARLISPVLKARRACIDFWYHMYGAHTGWLRVMLKRTIEQRLWYKLGNQKNEWHNARLYIFSYVPYQIIFEGTRGRGFASDIALDDIKITSGRCPKKQPNPVAVQLNWCLSKRWSQACCKTCERATKSGGQ